MKKEKSMDKKQKSVVLIHQGAELYGSDYIFSMVVKHVSQIARTVVVLDSDGPLVAELTPYAEELHILPLGVLRRKYMSAKGLFYLAWTIVHATWRLRKLIKNNNACLVYTNTIGVMPGALAAAICRIPHIIHVHEILVKPPVVAKSLARFAAIFSSTVIAVSGPVASFLSKHAASKADRIRVIHNGINAKRFDDAEKGLIRSEFDISTKTYLIAMVGRLHFWKGQDVLIEAARILVDNGFNDFQVLLFGDVFSGYEEFGVQLKKKVTEYQLESFIKFCGFRTDAANLFVDADVVVVPSTLPDPLPTVVLEGMAANKPVIATQHGGSLEMIEDGITGFLIEPNSPAELARTLSNLMRNRELGVDMGNRGRERLELFFSESRFRQDLLALVKSEIKA